MNIPKNEISMEASLYREQRIRLQRDNVKSGIFVDSGIREKEKTEIYSG